MRQLDTDRKQNPGNVTWTGAQSSANDSDLAQIEHISFEEPVNKNLMEVIKQPGYEVLMGDEAYRALFDGLLNGMAYCRMIYAGAEPVDFVYLAVNAAFTHQTGLTDVVGKRASEAIPGLCEADGDLIRIFGRVATTGKPERFEYFVTALQMWFLLSVYSPAKDHFVAIFDVITERKKAEEATRLFRALIDQLNDAIEVLDPDTLRFLDVNQRGCLDLGYSREELLSMSLFDTDPLMDQVTATSIVQGLRESGSKIIESRHRRKDGSEFPVEVSLSYIRLDRDYMLSIARNITWRKQLLEAVHDSEEQFRGLVEQAIAGIYMIQDGKFTYVNPRFAELFGYDSTEELIGRDPLSVVAEKDRDAVDANIRQRLVGGVVSLKSEFIGLRKDGSTLNVGVHGSSVILKGRMAVIGLLQDISEKKRAEKEIKRHVMQLENALMSTVNVATTLSELRDPYTAGHERRVAQVAVAIGAELGFDESRQEGLRVAGFLHDIGKITLPAEILAKPGKLSALEYRMIQGHPQSGYDVLKDVEFPWPVAQVALQHHERMDGSGYPQGLKGEAILLEARIMAVADVVEAMSSHRPYRPELGIEKALAEIERGRGTLYDPVAADACLKIFHEKGYKLPE